MMTLSDFVLYRHRHQTFSAVDSCGFRFQLLITMLVILYQRTSVYRVYSLIFRNFRTLLSFFVDFLCSIHILQMISLPEPSFAHRYINIRRGRAAAPQAQLWHMKGWQSWRRGRKPWRTPQINGAVFEKNHSKWGRLLFPQEYGIIGFEALKNLLLFRSFGEVPRNAFSAPGSRTEVWKETLFRDVSKTILPMRFFFGVNIHLPFVVVCTKGRQGLDSYIPIWRRIIHIYIYIYIYK